jgi:serine/threonine protein kinase/Tfp pilus assembly protein PilF
MLLDPLGHGAMGAVYRAYDPQLDRLIAIKRLLRDGDRPAHLLREAQAIARLSHPNVVQVHDVGRDEQTGDAFIAMELIDGGTLRTWLREQPRSCREITAAFVAAGRGLAAAHAQGVVHRDFKPENVLVATSGEVKVVDFGLGTVSGQSKSQETLRSHSERIQLDITDSSAPGPHEGEGLRVGTPAYMPPEQLLGAPTDPRADQFSLAIALYEALNGRLPFEGRTANQYAVSVLDGRPAPFVRGANVARRQQRAIFRAMSVDPDDRFATLTSFLAELDPRPARRHRAYALGGAMALASALLTVAGSHAMETEDVAPECAASASRLEASWNPDARAAMAEAMARVGGTIGVDTAARASLALDDLSQAWRDARTDACVSTRRGTPTYDPRVVCLERARERIEGLVEALRAPKPETFEHAIAAIEVAGDYVVGCSDPARLAQWTQTRAQLPSAQVADALEQARHWLALGDTRRGLAALRELPVQSSGVAGFEVELSRGRLAAQNEDLDVAKAALVHAGQLGVGHAQPLGAAEWNQAWADLLYARDEYAQMDEAYVRAADLLATSLGSDDPQAIEAAATRGHLLSATGQYERALEIYRDAQTHLRAVVGETNRHRFNVDEWVFGSLAHVGRYAEAHAEGTDLHARLERTLGPDHPRTLDVVYRLGVLQLRAGDHVTALASFRRALQGHEHQGGQSPLSRAAIEANIGGALMGLQRDADALQMYQRAEQSLHRAGVGSQHRSLLAVRASVGALLDRRGDHVAAEEVLVATLADLDAAGLQTTSNALMVRLNLAHTQLNVGHAADAVDTLNVGIERAGRAGDAVLRGRLRHELAHAYDTLGQTRDADVAIAEACEDLRDPAAATFLRAALDYAAVRESRSPSL